jgi:AraC family L-rhamnose operon transcriptional activator RhaR
MDGRIFHLRNRILNDLKHQWTIEEMADFAELSAPHLQKLFKVQMGMPPIAYLRELRLEKARELLETTFCRVKQIGLEIGMPNDSHFTRDFKKKYGSTPSEYRKRHSEKTQF